MALRVGLSFSSRSSAGSVTFSEQLYLSTDLLRSGVIFVLLQHLEAGIKRREMVRWLNKWTARFFNFNQMVLSRTALHLHIHVNMTSSTHTNTRTQLDLRSILIGTGQLVGNEISQLTVHLPATYHLLLSIQHTMQNGKLPSIYSKRELVNNNIGKLQSFSGLL